MILNRNSNYILCYPRREGKTYDIIDSITHNIVVENNKNILVCLPNSFFVRDFKDRGLLKNLVKHNNRYYNPITNSSITIFNGGAESIALRGLCYDYVYIDDVEGFCIDFLYKLKSYVNYKNLIVTTSEEYFISIILKIFSHSKFTTLIKHKTLEE